MPTVVCKITNDNGTESSFGPVELSDDLTEKIAAMLDPLEEDRIAEIADAQLSEAVAEADQRNADAEAANQARIAQSEEGINPDTGEAH